MWKKLRDKILENSDLFGFCYLQLAFLVSILCQRIRFDLFALSIVSTAILSFFPKKGKIVILAGFFLCCFFTHLVILDLWQISLELSFALSLLIFSVSFENRYAKNPLYSLKNDFIKKNQFLEEELKKSEDFHVKLIASMKEELLNREKQVYKIEQASKKKEQELLSKLLNKDKEIAQKLNCIEHEKKSLVGLLRKGEVEKIVDSELKEAISQFLLKRLPKTDWERLYKQLLSQFNEKDDVLHQVRHELFKSSEALLSLNKKRDEELLLDTDGNEKARAIVKANEQVKRLEEEIRLLKELISVLNEQLKEKDRNKKKKLVEDSESFPLFT